MSDDMRPKILTGLPAGTKAGGVRADFKPKMFDQALFQKGQRVWWSRASLCPCSSPTSQAAPTCVRCHGQGWIYELPGPYLEGATKDSVGNPIEFSDDGLGVGIRVLITGLTKDEQIFEKFGTWIFSQAKATPQAANRLSYRDSLTCRDQLLDITQLIDASGNATIPVTGSRSLTGLWTPLAEVNILRSLATDFRQGSDFQLEDNGTITWIGTPPVAGTKISLHGRFHPRWVILDHVFADRSTWIKAKKSSEEFTELPQSSLIKLDFLVDA